ncbi:SDR family NAD(P)-dependent oxidoreductase [Pseudorhodobacter turbinis]|uniref:SDR family NAD(P)-dependent oxidoreductase n=1 Tax=Pseudorhodobacter turbinis TaxID=2500533 RepID=A0A4P8EH09_9RHOB|nr:SDR family NAD(P)-dependent oxidoreductase [Pseudorhodobacter turbinis]QCO56109.1 SDR family NAD(P)-dependent oxidoreductase [Pseudorhodobacter turbinis]
MRDWQGKRYWIVGAGEGLGLGLARRISTAGAEVILSSRSDVQLEKAVAQMPGKAHAVTVDVADTASVARAAAEVGDVDGVVFLDEVYWPVKAQEWNAEHVEAMCNANFTGCARVVGAVLPAMVARGAGHLVMTGSLAGYRGVPGTNGFGASKAGVMAMAETLRADLRGSGIEVQLANLGFIRGNQGGDAMPFMMEAEDAAQQMFELMLTERFKVSVPTGSSWLVRLSRCLPDAVFNGMFARK